MNQQVETADTPVEEVKVRIRPDLKRYVPDKSGNGKRTHRTDDFVARTLAGKSIDEIKKGADLLTIDHTKWEHLNVGQQRMLIGNALRHRLVDKKAPLSEADITSVYGEPCAEYVAPEPKVEAAPSDESEKAEEKAEGEEPEVQAEKTEKARKRVAKKQ